MNRDVYSSLVSKLSTITPLFAKALLDIALSKRNLTADQITPVQLLQLIREDLDPKLASSLTTCNSILLAGAGMIVADAENKLVFMNSGAKQLLSVIQTNSGDCDPKLAFGALRERGFLKPANELRDVEVQEIFSVDLGRTYNVSIAPIFSEQGSVIQTVSVIQDNTLKHGLEQEVLAFCAQLQNEIICRQDAEERLSIQFQRSVAASKMAALGEMAANIAHEINTPLAVIGLAAGQIATQLKRETFEPAQLTHFTETIARTVQRISKIIIGLRTFSRDGSRDEFRKENLRQILNDTVALCAEKFASHGTVLSTDGVPNSVEAECRASQISQVLLNLLGNADDALVDAAEKWIRVDAAEDEDFVEISVTNAGPAIAPETRARLFRPFFTTKEVGKGTGLGLSISRAIAEDHRGTLSLDIHSPVTRFVLRIRKSLQS